MGFLDKALKKANRKAKSQLKKAAKDVVNPGTSAKKATKKSTSSVHVNPQLEESKRCLKQLNETIDLINTTVKPDVFFKRYNFALDLCLRMEEFKRYYKQQKPMEIYFDLEHNMEKHVNAFLYRSYSDMIQATEALKTQKAKDNRVLKYFVAIDVAFEQCHSFWEGSIGSPHYEKELYKKGNLDTIAKLKEKHAGIL